MSEAARREVKLSLSARVYSRPAALLAAQVRSRWAEVKVGAEAGGRFTVSVGAAEPERAAAEFLNEALNQQCRIDLREKNYAVAEMITVKALLSAAGGRGDVSGRGKRGAEK